MPASIKPSTINWVLANVLSHFHQSTCFIIARFMSNGWIFNSNSSTSRPSSWAATCSEYQSWNFLYRKVFASLFTEMTINCNRSVQLGGTRQASMSFASNREFISSVTWPLKLSMITKHICCQKYPSSHFLCREGWFLVYTESLIFLHWPCNVLVTGSHVNL